VCERKKKLPPLTHPLKVGCKTSIHMFHPMHKQLSDINHHSKTNYYNTSPTCKYVNY
jgi:hypothetical protein